MGVGSGAPRPEDQSEPLYNTGLLLEQVLGMGYSSPQKNCSIEHWDSWILPRLTDDPTARDLSIRVLPSAQVGRSGEAKARPTIHELQSGQK